MSSLSSALASTRNGDRPLLNLQLGWPSSRLCGREGLLIAAIEALSPDANMAPILLYGPGKGHPPLCESLAEWLSTVYKPSAGPTDASRICVTNGASGSLANVLLKFSDPTYTRRVFMVEPTYFLACPIAEDTGFQGKLQGIPENGPDCIDLNFLRNALKKAEAEEWPAEPLRKTGPNYPYIYKYILYVSCTTYSNPSAKTMPVSIRESLVKLAREYDILLISDDVYDFLGWTTDTDDPQPVDPPPRLVDIDRNLRGTSIYGNAISNGSFAKIIGPGIRVGWVECTPTFASDLGLVGSSSSGGNPAHFTSTLVDRMLRSKSLQLLISDVLIPEYRKRFSALMSAINKELLPMGFTVEATGPRPGTAGGYFTYIRIPTFFAAHRVFARTLAGIALRDYSLRIAFGHMFVVAGDDSSWERAETFDGFGYCLRLSWAWLESEQIEEAVSRLAECTANTRRRIEAGEDVTEGVQIGIR